MPTHRSVAAILLAVALCSGSAFSGEEGVDWDTIKDGAREGGHAVMYGLRKAKDAVVHGAEVTGEKVGDGYDATKEFVVESYESARERLARDNGANADVDTAIPGVPVEPDHSPYPTTPGR